MSTEQSVDPRLVEETKKQIQGLVSEIAELGRAGLEPSQYYAEFLNRVVQALAAHGGIVWSSPDGRSLEVAYQINLQGTGLVGNPAAQAKHSGVLQQVQASGEPMLVAPQSGSGGDKEAGNPTEFLLVLAPVRIEDEVRGIIEIFQRPVAKLSTQRGYLDFLRRMCELAGDYLKTRQLRQFSARQNLWTQLETFTRSVHSSLDPTETAFTIANEGRRLIECDRVTVAIRKGRKCYVRAISGQDTFDKRSNLVTLLNWLSSAVARTGEPMWYTGDTTDMPPQVEEAVQAYVDESHSKTVAVLPLHRPGTDDEEQQRSDPIGALIVEQIEDARPREGMEQRVDVVAQHSAMALSNALSHHELFLMPLWRLLGKSRWIVQARTLPKTISILIAAVALIAALFVVPYNFELQGKGRLVPAVRRDIFASQDGTVQDLLVKHGGMVNQGDVVAVLRNPNLDYKIADVSGRMEASSKKISGNVLLLQEGRRMSDEQRMQLEAENEAERELLKSLQEQRRILKEEELELRVLSPIAGQIITWDVENKLKGRSINKGQAMMEVADPSGTWELELLMPEHRMGHISEARRTLGDPLKVTFILATEPDKKHVGMVTEIHSAAEIRGEEGNTVLMRVAIDKADVKDLHLEAAITGRVYCGRRSIGYVWFHDIVDWIYSHIIFRL